MLEKVKTIYYLLAGIVLLTLSHMSFSVNITAWIAYTPFLLYLSGTRGLKSRLLFIGALLIGWSLVVSKIITPPLVYGFVFLYSVPIILFHLPGFLVWDRFKEHRWAYLLFPAIMTLMEWIQYTFTPLASWGAAAYSQVDSLVIMQSLSLFGMPGLSFLIYWVNISIAKIIITRKFEWGTLYLPVLSIGLLILLGAVRINQFNKHGKETMLVAAVGTDSETSGLPLPSKAVRDQIKEVIFERTEIASNAGAKIIVWNEGATFVLPEEEVAWIDSVKHLAKQNEVYIYASFVMPITMEPLKYENKYCLIDPKGNLIDEYNKHEPVPGEPAEKGRQPLEVHVIEEAKAGGAICYDYNFPYLAKEYGDLDADIVAVPSSDWRGIDPLHTKMAAFRAVEQGHSILRSTRFGLSAAINPLGDMVAKMSSFDQNNKIMLAHLPVKGVTTLYSIIGDVFVYLCIGFIVFFFFWIYLPKRSL